MKIEPISKYCYNRGAYCLRSKWPRRFKVFMSAMLFAGALTITSNSPAPHVETLTSQKLTYVEYVSDQGNINRSQAQKIVEAIQRWSNKYQLDEKLVLAVAKVESNFHHHAISSSGAMGIMQIIPSWHKDKIKEARSTLGNPEVFNINTNVYLGTRILNDCIERFSKIRKALMCYSGNTKGYDDKVLATYEQIKKL